MLSPARRAGGDQGGMSWPDAAERSEGPSSPTSTVLKSNSDGRQRSHSASQPDADLTDNGPFEGVGRSGRSVRLFDCRPM